ncbi:hypothetical protein LCGC14_2036060 [marine sediment metagenome]|uniref:Uncharacterized protein n=1 Tax=marine sediment metagenome TaxID=412755 RepID=A0A0F9FFW8_9ZZZZ
MKYNISQAKLKPKPLHRAHCWENGPLTEDGCSTSCMEWGEHFGPHIWVRDDEIKVSFQ